MLTQIKLTNFKCFKNETIFPLSQLNLLTGINGQGKSTLLQSLLLMRQSIEHNENPTQILLNGSCVNLGNFNDIRNSSTSTKESIIFEFEYDFSQEFHLKYYLVENIKDNMSIKIEEMTGSSQKASFYFSKIHYISADRFGPQEFYLKSNLTTFPNVGVKGELTANVLDKKKDNLVNDKLCLGEDAQTLITQTEAWLNEIFDGAKVEIPHSETNILELFLNTNASRDRFKPINVGFGYSYILPIVVSGLIAKEGKNIFSRDIKKFLLKIIDHSEPTHHTVEDIIELLDKHHEATIYGLLCLHEVKSIEEKYLVYNQHNWFAFHRYFLGRYPISENHFYHECQKYFPQLFFHERVEKTLKGLKKGLHDFSKIIVHHLTRLNDEFCKDYNRSNRIDSLKKFSSACDVDASPQGNAEDKPKMTFEFVNNKSNVKEPVCCEPHLKLGKSDDSGNSHYYFNRIYFHEGKENIANGRILIAHIGKHIQFD